MDTASDSDTSQPGSFHSVVNTIFISQHGMECDRNGVNYGMKSEVNGGRERNPSPMILGYSALGYHYQSSRIMTINPEAPCARQKIPRS